MNGLLGEMNSSKKNPYSSEKTDICIYSFKKQREFLIPPGGLVFGFLKSQKKNNTRILDVTRCR